MSDFPLDEFDQAATQGGPVGAHRKRTVRWFRWVAPFLVLILAGLAAYGVVVYLWRSSGGDGLPPTGAQVTPTVTETVVSQPETSSAPETVSPSATSSATPTPTPTVDPVDFDATVVVLNAAGIGGLAGRNQAELEAGGFTDVAASNLTQGLPDANTVRYRDARLESTAREVARVLGISVVEQGIVPAGEISVILVSDPDA